MGRRMQGPSVLLGVACVALMVAVSVPVSRPIRGEGASSSTRRGDQEILKEFAPLVGSWRGVGQVERGRARGSWTESAAWAWKLTGSSAALELSVTKGKHLKSGLLRPGKKPGSF